MTSQNNVREALYKALDEEMPDVQDRTSKHASEVDATPFFVGAFLESFEKQAGRELSVIEARAFQRGFAESLYEKAASDPSICEQLVEAGLSGALGSGMNMHNHRMEFQKQGQELPVSFMLVHPIDTVELLSQLDAPETKSDMLQAISET